MDHTAVLTASEWLPERIRRITNEINRQSKHLILYHCYRDTSTRGRHPAIASTIVNFRCERYSPAIPSSPTKRGDSLYRQKRCALLSIAWLHVLAANANAPYTDDVVRISGEKSCAVRGPRERNTCRLSSLLAD